MPTAYWGVSQALDLVLPDTLLEWLLLFCYTALFLALLFRDRRNLQQFSLRKWAGWLALGILALVASQLFPVSLNPVAIPFSSTETDPHTIALLAAVPSLLAGVVLGPGPALLVGMSAGLGQALGQSHALFDLYHYAFAAWLAGTLMHIRYDGRRYAVLRMPVVSGTLSQGSIALMAGFTAFLLGGAATLLSRSDMAFAAVGRDILPLLVEGFFGGIVVTMILLVMPAWRSGKELVPNPGQRSVRNYLLSNLLLFSTAVLLVVLAATFVIAQFVSTRLVLAELAAEANAATARLVDFEVEMEHSLAFYGGEPDLLEGSKVNGRALSRLYRMARHYDQVLIVDGRQNIAGTYPTDASAGGLTEKEFHAVNKVLRGDASSLVVDADQRPGSPISMIVPIIDVAQGEKMALIGRVKMSSVAEAFGSLAPANGPLSAAIVGLDDEAVVEFGTMDGSWLADLGSPDQAVAISEKYDGTAFLRDNEAQARQLIYLGPAGSRSWRIAASVPYELVLRQTFGVAVPMMILLIAVAGVFYARLANYSRSLSGSITELTSDSRRMIDGAAVSLIPDSQRQDEIGELSRSLALLQRDMKKRLDELSLLLSVSRESSASFDLAESLPIVLQGALRGTGASAARIVVLNPSEGRPIALAEGPAADSMAVYDRSLMSLLRSQEELALASPQAIRGELPVAQEGEALVKALYAVPLKGERSYLGFLVVGFRQERVFSLHDRELLQTLARQASLQVEKNYLFTYAEGGRKRLAAVLSSTSEAVIVTDQTSRILIVNRAMERAFDIQANKVIGRTIADTIDVPQLVKALTANAQNVRELEIVGKDRRTYVANLSTIVGHEGQSLGRVALLHDVTNLKQLDRLKSEFVDNVSHDLRTPLTVLSGYVSALVLLEDLSPEQRNYTDQIVRSVERMMELVDNLLDIGRIESGVDLLFEETDIGTLLQELAEEHWLFAHESGVRLHVNVPPDLPLVQCDATLVRQALANLLMNGFKYAPNSGDMTLAANRSDHEIVISVRDRGPGIAANDQLRLFEKFYRVKRHGAGKAKGSGLGLAIVKGIAEKHGGHAWCSSDEGKGSTFSISLPLEQ